MQAALLTPGDTLLSPQLNSEALSLLTSAGFCSASSHTQWRRAKEVSRASESAAAAVFPDTRVNEHREQLCQGVLEREVPFQFACFDSPLIVREQFM